MGLLDFFKKGKEEPAKDSSRVTGIPGQQNQGFFNKDKMGTTPGASMNQDVYTVQSGDSLSKIAKKHYGNANAWTKIYNANKGEIGDNPDLIHPGQKFVIPRD
jgi:nucleoid-associated protein YgaU